MSGKRTKEPRVRFEEKIGLGRNGCWTWLAAKDKNGYGYFGGREGVAMAHRFAYELYLEPIPAGLVIDHLCRNPSCVNPFHMEPVTIGVNVTRGINTMSQRLAARTHCKNGHEFTPQNTFKRIYGRGCRACRNASTRKCRNA